MQLNKKLIPLAVVALSATAPLVLNAASSDEVSFKHMTYSENDGRIDIDFNVLDIKKDFGTDYSVNFSASHDAISGGTPIWYDSTSGASHRLSEDGSDRLGENKSDMSEYTYENVEIDDTRKATNLSLTKRTPSRDEISLGVAYSEEEDFKSIEGSFGYLYNMDKTRNSSIAAGISYQSNSAHHHFDDTWKDFKIINTQIGYTHTFTRYTVGQVNYFYIKQSGVLDNPYQTIIRTINDAVDGYSYYLASEKRPEEKNSAGITTDLVSKLNPDTSWHGDYRLYKDDWGVLSHTISTSVFYDLGYDFTLIPLIRYYQQSEAVFYKAHDGDDATFNSTDYGSSDERLSKFHSLAYSLGVEKKFTKYLSGNIHYAKESQSFGLDMKWLSFGLNYNF